MSTARGSEPWTHHAAKVNGPLIIPSFAVERTQELLVDLFLLAQNGDVPANLSIFVDSPLATRASAPLGPMTAQKSLLSTEKLIPLRICGPLDV